MRSPTRRSRLRGEHRSGHDASQQHLPMVSSVQLLLAAVLRWLRAAGLADMTPPSKRNTAECGYCGFEGPDSFGNYDLLESDDCPVHGPALECLEGPEGCRGSVEMRWPGYGETLWPRCERHGNARLEREEENIRRNMPDGPGAPVGFDPMAAGECWDEEVA